MYRKPLRMLVVVALAAASLSLVFATGAFASPDLELVYDAQVLPSSGVDPDDRFGVSVDMSASKAFVGARGASFDHEDEGAVFVYEQAGGVWTDAAILHPSDPENAPGFGHSLASTDRWLVVGTSNVFSGFYILDRASGFNEVASFSGILSLGTSVDVSQDVVVAGAPERAQTGRAYVYRLEGGTWIQEAELDPPGLFGGEEFGLSVAVDGNLLAVGAPGKNSQQGAVFIFTHEPSTGWQLTDEIRPAETMAFDRFGTAVQLHDGRLLASSRRGDGHQPDSGVIYEFTVDSGSWHQTDRIMAPAGLCAATTSASFGRDFDADADRLFVATFGCQEILLFERVAGTYVFQAVGLPDTGVFGGLQNVASEAGFVVAGAPIADPLGETPPSVPGRGSAHLFNVQAGNEPPSVDVGGPYVVDEGQDVVLDATAEDPDGVDPTTGLWDIGGVLPPPPPQPLPLNLTIPAVAAGDLPRDEAVAVSVEVFDSDGASASDTTTLTINNVPPDVAPIPDQEALLGDTVVVEGLTFTDAIATIPGSFDMPTTTGPFDAAIDWGDGMVEELAYTYDGAGNGELFSASGLGAEPASHAYAAAGVYTATVRVSDGLAQDEESFTVTVTDPVVCTIEESDVKTIWGVDFLFGTNGDDVICGSDAGEIIFARNGDDIVFAGDGDDLILGGRGFDQLFGEGGDDRIFGGFEYSHSADGDDLMDGGPGDDLIFGGRGDDELHGGDGADQLFGGFEFTTSDGDDTLFGDAGDDLLIGGVGFDALDGGDDTDTCHIDWPSLNQDGGTATNCEEGDTE